MSHYYLRGHPDAIIKERCLHFNMWAALYYGEGECLFKFDLNENLIEVIDLRGPRHVSKASETQWVGPKEFYVAWANIIECS